MAKKEKVEVIEEEVISDVAETLEEILSAPVGEVVEINGKFYTKTVDANGSTFLA